MAKSALPLLLLGGGALLLMSKKKPTTGKSTGKQPGPEPEPGPEPGPEPEPESRPAPIPGDQVQEGELMRSGFVMTDRYGAINWTVRRYARGPQFYTTVYDPDDREMEVATVGHLENDLVRLFDDVEVAKEWIIAFINSAIDRDELPPPQPEPDIEPDPERGTAYQMAPGVYPNSHVYSRFGLQSPYRTPETTVTIRRKSGMIHYPAKPDEARFVGWNPKNPEEALVDIDAKGEYSIMTHDGGPKGVFIAEWVLKVTEG